MESSARNQSRSSGPRAESASVAEQEKPSTESVKLRRDWRTFSTGCGKEQLCQSAQGLFDVTIGRLGNSEGLIPNFDSGTALNAIAATWDKSTPGLRRLRDGCSIATEAITNPKRFVFDTKFKMRFRDSSVRIRHDNQVLSRI
jgi:hypothetical protein